MSKVDDQPYNFEPIFALAKSLQDVHRQAVQLYTPEVDAIVRSRSRDIRRIEQTLDSLLSFCSHDDAVVVYKKLCRFYFDIDPVATADYVNAYRDLWDVGAEQEQ